MRTPTAPQGERDPAFALISVLALVSLAALTATAFLASARLEKIASMSTGDQTRLTLALDSGYHLGSYPFTSGSGDNTWNWVDYLVGEDSDGVGYLYHASPYSGANSGNIGQWYNYATFSCATLSNIGVSLVDPTNYSATTTWQGGFARDRLNPTSRLCRMTNFATTNVTPNGPVTRIPLLFGRTSPVVNWITNYVTNPSTGLLSPTFRFAYFTEDPSGLIDAERMGGSLTRNTGTNPNEFALGEIGLTNIGTFTNLRKLFLNPGMIEAVIRTNKLYISNGSLTNPWRYLSSSFYSANGWLSTNTNNLQSYQRVPSGLGYSQADTTNASTNKLVLSTNSPNFTFDNIASVITTNLPNFGKIRSGTTNPLSPDSYISNIVANIVDYVDTNSIPTVDTKNVIPTWRGVEPIGWPNEVFMRLNLTARQTNPPNYLFTLAVKHYIEVWNLSSTSVVVNGSNYSISNNLFIPLQCTNWRGNLASADTNNKPTNEVCTNSFELPPNSYGVIATPTRNFNILVPIALTLPGSAPSLSIQPGSTTNNSYTIRYQGMIVDATPGGRWLGTATNMKVGDFHFITTSVNFGTSANGNQYNLAGGDPRGGLFVYQPAMDFPYNQTTPGGRNSHLSSSGGARIVDPSVNWVDGGHSLGDKGSDTVASPANPNVDNSINQISPTAKGNTNHWIQKINNSGSMTNIMELGNIFDPIQWGDSKNPFHPLDTAAWMGLSNSASPFNGACGRNTLRVGRPEHARFAWTNVSGQAQPNMQASAAALLDLFCADTNTSPALMGRFDDGDQVNINTAPPKVLRALAAGVVLNNDPAMKPISPYPIPPVAIDAFVKGVTNFRAKYPFYSASQLTFIGTNANWPNTNDWPAGAVFSTNIVGNNVNFEWNDAAAEEWFSKIYALSKVNTRNYRIYVQAQLIKTRGTNTNVNSLVFGAIGRRYYDVLNQQNNTNAPPSCSTYLLRKVDY